MCASTSMNDTRQDNAFLVVINRVQPILPKTLILTNSDCDIYIYIYRTYALPCCFEFIDKTVKMVEIKVKFLVEEYCCLWLLCVARVM